MRQKAIEKLNKFEITDEMRKENELFIESRPESIKDVIRKYSLDPFKIYTTKEGAPYRMTHAGSVLSLCSFLEIGRVGVLCWWTEDDRIKNVEELLECPIKTYIDPEWLEEVII